MRVCILVSVTDPNYFDNCTLVFKTLRVGFPTAYVDVVVNGVGREEDAHRAVEVAKRGGADYVYRRRTRWHMADWIQNRLACGASDLDPVVILDPDVHFWKSCEDWKFDALMAGFYHPEMYNDWSQCRSVQRLHTSFLWFSNPRALFARIGEVYPRWAEEYTPCNPFMGSVQFVNGEPIFWDVCAGLYNMIGGAHFGPEHLACYEHLNSASWVEEQVKRLGGKTGEDFRMFHKLAPHDPELVRAFGWPMVKNYYNRKHIESRVMPAHFRDPVDRMKLPG